MTSMAIAEMALTLCSQRLLFAGQPILFKSNSPRIARYAGDFLQESPGLEASSTEARATIIVHVRETDEQCESAPLFRARGQFAFARFTRADSFWFNLRAREVYGVCSPELADDSWRWRVHIFPALLGILSAVIDVAPVHAACLVRRGEGVLLAGQSGAGKSTLTVAMAKRGYALLSDDWTYLSTAGSEVEAWGLPVPVKLLPDARRFFPELIAYDMTNSLNGEIAYEVFPEECFGISRGTRCPVTGVVLLERAAKPGCSITPVGAAEAIDHLAREVEPLEGSLARCYERQIDLIRHLGNVSCQRVSFSGHPESVAEALDIALAVMR